MADGLSPKLPGRGRGRPYEKGRSGNPAGRRTGSRNKATLAAAALLAGESEALTRRAVEFALGRDPTAMRLCLERILPPCRERTVKFALPPIESAPTGQSPWAEGPRHRRGDEGGHLGAAQRRDHAGRGGEDRGGGRHLCPGDRCQAISTGACRNSKTRPRRTLWPALQSRDRHGSTTDRRVFAADLLQVQQRETIGSILDCKSRPWPLAGRHAFCDHSRRDGGDTP
jgi:Family of unknown function (DUF5681)